jgi:site-specific recombinase XerD
MNLGTRAFTNEELIKMFEGFESKRDSTLFLLGTKTGFRISELLSIKVSDLYGYDYRLKSILTVSKQKMKGKTASRSIPLSNDTLCALNNYLSTLPTEQVYLFESREKTKLSRTQAWRNITQVARKIGLTGKIATHSARKTYAKNVYEKLGKDLVKTQKAMGHASINSTVAYLQVNMDEINEAIKSL